MRFNDESLIIKEKRGERCCRLCCSLLAATTIAERRRRTGKRSLVPGSEGTRTKHGGGRQAGRREACATAGAIIETYL